MSSYKYFKLHKMKRISIFSLVLAAFILLPVGKLKSQDPRERTYYYPVLRPMHDPKPAVDGWAEERVAEKLDRGLIAQRCEDGSVYIGWRLLSSDAD